jgi:hypothetical protein
MNASEGGISMYFRRCAAGGFFIAGAAQYVSAALFGAAFIVIHVAILSTWFVGAAAMIGILALYTKAYSVYYRAYYRCPDCHEAMDIPVFLCKCGTKHTRLWPSLYGVLHHTCKTCGEKLATTEWNGRGAIDRRCAHCSHPLNVDIGALTNVHIPVVGGPLAGKSNLIVAAVHQLIHRSQSSGRLQVAFPDPAHEREFKANVERLARGREMAKTTDIVPQAYNLSITQSGDRVGKLVYVYDAAGEAYSTESQSLQQTYFRYAHGVVFVIDPFSIPDVVATFGDQIDAVRAVLRPSPLKTMESYERMLTVLESNVGLVRGRAYPHPISVVVTKVDALTLEAHIGAPAAESIMAADTSVKSQSDAVHQLVRQFLVRHRLDNFVRDIEGQFSSVRFFSCSALGRMPDASGAGFAPLRVLDPVASILVRAGVINSTSLSTLTGGQTA